MRDEHALSVAVIGAGTRAREMIRVYKKLGREVTAVFSRTKEKAYQMVDELGLLGTDVYENLPNLLEHDVSPAIYIASSNNSHANYSLDCLYHGRHTLTETLLANSVIELSRIESTIKTEPYVFMEANTTLSSPLLKHIGQLILSDQEIPEIGKVGIIEISYGAGKHIDFKSTVSDPSHGGGLLKNVGCYAVGAAVRLLGTQVESKISSIEKITQNCLDLRGGSEIRNQNGLSALISFSLIEQLPSTIIIGGERGYISINDYLHSLKYTTYADGQKLGEFDMTAQICKGYELDPTVFQTPKEIALAVQILDFEAAVAQGFQKANKENLNNYRDSVAVVRILYEMMAHMDRIHI